MGSGYLLILLLAFPASSCNVVRMQARQTEKTFHGAHLVEHSFKGADGPLHVWATPFSTRPKLMLVHGITSSAAMWTSNVATLSTTYDLIIPDLIGHGGSTDAWSGNSVDAQVSHLAAILDSLNVEGGVFLVGTSYGGAIAANLAEQRPDRVRALVIADGPANTYTKAVADSAARALGATDILDFFNPTDASGVQRGMDAILFAPRKLPGFALRQLHAAGAAKRPGYTALLKDMIQREDRYAQHRYQWTMPVYVLWGEGDRLIPPSVGRGIMAINELPADHLVMVPQAGHAANLEQPAVFEATLLRVLQDGPCVMEHPVGDGPCTMEYLPWCGCDGKTYPNRCAAWRAGTRLVAPGECP